MEAERKLGSDKHILNASTILAFLQIMQSAWRDIQTCMGDTVNAYRTVIWQN